MARRGAFVTRARVADLAQLDLLGHFVHRSNLCHNRASLDSVARDERVVVSEHLANVLGPQAASQRGRAVVVDGLELVGDLHGVLEIRTATREADANLSWYDLFAAAPTVKAAYHLESIARDQQLDEAEDAWLELERQVDILLPVLGRIRDEM